MAERLTSSDILDLSESGGEADPLGRATSIWHAVTGAPADELERRPVGERDHALLRSRIATLGPHAPSFVACPACGQELEFDLDLRDLLVVPDGTTSDAAVDPGSVDRPASPTHVLHHGDWRVELRLPTIADLRAVADGRGGAAELLRRCVLTVERDGEDQPVEAAGEIAEAIDAEMRRLDPQAQVDLKLDCAACDHHWTAVFDIAHFYGRELEVEAGRLLGEVHRLASAYSWSETEILALSAARRRAYLARVGT